MRRGERIGDGVATSCLAMASRLCLSVLLLLPIGFAWSDDAAITGVGGTIRPMKSHPSVVLRSQVVRVKINRYNADVDCTFVLHNTGKATSVLIGFPEGGSGTDVGPSTKGFKYFRSYVDGKRVKVRVYDQEGDYGYYSRWYVKRVYFQAGQTRVIRNLYGMSLGLDSIGHAFFEYELSTGASWKGKIGRADIIVQLIGLEDATDWRISPKGYRRVKNQIIWRFRNFEPKKDIFILCFACYRLYLNNDYELISFDETIRQRGVFLLEVHRLRAIRDIQISWNHSAKSVTIMNVEGNRRVVLRVGSRWALANGQRILLPVTPSLHRKWERWTVKVPVRAVVNALGGQVHYERDRASLFITLNQGGRN
jgi:hypothetical protein